MAKDLEAIMRENESAFWASAPSGWIDPKVKDCVFNPESGFYEVAFEGEIWGFRGDDGVPYGNSYWHIRKSEA